MTPQRYRAILIDPPWKYEVYSEATGHGRSAESHYSTMTMPELYALPVANLADQHCAMFMWCTWPTIDTAFGLAAAWGFEYKTCAFVWAKLNERVADRFVTLTDDANWFMGMGHWTRANTEACLLFTRGQPRRLARDVRQLIVAPVREHSRKPDEQYSLIERLVEGPYLEMFARRKHSESWSVWGNEVASDISFAGIEAAQ